MQIFWQSQLECENLQKNKMWTKQSNNYKHIKYTMYAMLENSCLELSKRHEVQ